MNGHSICRRTETIRLPSINLPRYPTMKMPPIGSPNADICWLLHTMKEPITLLYRTKTIRQGIPVRIPVRIGMKSRRWRYSWISRTTKIVWIISESVTRKGLRVPSNAQKKVTVAGFFLQTFIMLTARCTGSCLTKGMASVSKLTERGLTYLQADRLSCRLTAPEIVILLKP